MSRLSSLHCLPFAGFLTETGKTRASTIFSTGTESAFQVTQIRIMVILLLPSLSNVTAIFKNGIPFQSLSLVSITRVVTVLCQACSRGQGHRDA